MVVHPLAFEILVLLGSWKSVLQPNGIFINGQVWRLLGEHCRSLKHRFLVARSQFGGLNLDHQAIWHNADSSVYFLVKSTLIFRYSWRTSQGKAYSQECGRWEGNTLYSSFNVFRHTSSAPGSTMQCNTFVSLVLEYSKIYAIVSEVHGASVCLPSTPIHTSKIVASAC